MSRPCSCPVAGSVACWICPYGLHATHVEVGSDSAHLKPSFSGVYTTRDGQALAEPVVVTGGNF